MRRCAPAAAVIAIAQTVIAIAQTAAAIAQTAAASALPPPPSRRPSSPLPPLRARRRLCAVCCHLTEQCHGSAAAPVRCHC